MGDGNEPQALLDDRFDPALIEATIKHVVEAWEAVSDGPAQPLSEVATKNGIRALEHPGGPGGRRYIRDATLSHWEVAEITPATGITRSGSGPCGTRAGP